MKFSRKLISLFLTLSILFASVIPALATADEKIDTFISINVDGQGGDYRYTGSPLPINFNIYASTDEDEYRVDKDLFDYSVTYSYDLGETWTDEVPVNPGTYAYRIEVFENDIYQGCTEEGYYCIWYKDSTHPVNAVVYIDYNFYSEEDVDFMGIEGNAKILKVDFFDLQGNPIDIGMYFPSCGARWVDYNASPRVARAYFDFNIGYQIYELADYTIEYVYDLAAWEAAQGKQDDLFIPEYGYTAAVPETAAPSIILMNAIKDHNYRAYQLFTGTPTDIYDENGNFVETMLSNVTWGKSASDNVKWIFSEWYADQTGTELDYYQDPLAAQKIAKLLSETELTNRELRELIDKISEWEVKNPLKPTEEYNAESGAYIFTYDDPGYYLICEKYSAIDPGIYAGHTSVSAYILATTRADENTVVTIKQPTDPEIDKQSHVKNPLDENGTLPSDYACYGDRVTYTLTATFPGNYVDENGKVHNFDLFDRYYFYFADLLPAYLKVDPYSIKVYANGSATPLKNEHYNVNYCQNADGGDIIEILSDLFTVYSYPPDEYNPARDFRIDLIDLKQLDYADADEAALTTLTVTYDVIVTTESPSAEDIVNTVYGLYTNDPRYGGDGMGSTPPAQDTFRLSIADLTKTDENGTALSGAEFVIGWKLDDDDVSDTPELWLIQNEDGTYTYTKNREDATVFISDEDGKILLEGLRRGIYSVFEVKAPAGYNKLDGLHDYSLPTDGNRVYTLTVVNERGLVLPSTGGVGTTLIYALGALMLFGFGITAVAKRRSTQE